MPDDRPETVGELIERFCARKTSRTGKALSPKTARSYRTQLAALAAAAGPETPTALLTARHVRQAVETPPSPKSRAAYLRASKALVRDAVRRGWLRHDVTEGVYADPGPDEIKPYLLPQEIPVLLDALSPSARIRAALIIRTGLRGEEATCLRWDWVVRGIGRPSIRVPGHDPVSGFTTKGKRARAIPLSDAAQAALEDARGMSNWRGRWGRHGYVLHAGERPVLHGNWSSRIYEVAKETPGVPAVGLHGLRRTAGVLWLGSGLSIYEVSRLLGHQSVQTTERHYADVVQADLAGKFGAVDAAEGVRRVEPEKKDEGEEVGG